MTQPFTAPRAVARLAAPLLALALFGGLTAQAAAADVTLNITGFYGIFQDRFTSTVIQPYEKAHPGIHIVYRPVKNSAEAMASLRLQRNRPMLDIAIVDISVATLANREKLFGPLSDTLVPNLQQIAPWGRFPGNYGAALTHDNLALIYNTQQVKTPLTSWKDIWQPTYKGKLGFPIADTRGVCLIPILSKMDGADYKKTIEPAIADLKRLAPSVQTWDPQPAVYEAVQSGSIAIGLGYNARGQYLHDQSGGVVAVALPKEGSVAQINTINLVGNSTHNAEAQAFINYALSADSQAAFAKASFYGPTNTTVKLDPALEARVNGSAEAAKNLIPVDWAWVTDRYTPWITRIKREVISQ
ncbi:extracellular solute-binding protein [Robbsia sp. KACC 23696]|uniref:extracellular solute-binding protein n=1 Tax=Robbsia sp. KACC 23696 TaxID=3149231 RepID=UPI00325B2174